MSIIIDTAPPPPPSFRERIEELEPGQSLRAEPDTIRNLRTSASRVRSSHPSRKFRVALADDGARVWRIA